MQGAVTADAELHGVVATGIIGGDGQTILAVTHIDNTGADTSFGVVNGIANAGERRISRTDINRDRLFTAALLDGQYAIAGGDGGFTVFLTILGGQRLRLRQLADANGVFPGNRAARGRGAES